MKPIPKHRHSHWMNMFKIVLSCLHCHWNKINSISKQMTSRLWSLKELSTRPLLHKCLGIWTHPWHLIRNNHRYLYTSRLLPQLLHRHGWEIVIYLILLCFLIKSFIILMIKIRAKVKVKSCKRLNKVHLVKSVKIGNLYIAKIEAVWTVQIYHLKILLLQCSKNLISWMNSLLTKYLRTRLNNPSWEWWFQECTHN